jgi:hypothetical protein
VCTDCIVLGLHALLPPAATHRPSYIPIVRIFPEYLGVIGFLSSIMLYFVWFAVCVLFHCRFGSALQCRNFHKPLEGHDCLEASTLLLTGILNTLESPIVRDARRIFTNNIASPIPVGGVKVPRQFTKNDCTVAINIPGRDEADRAVTEHREEYSSMVNISQALVQLYKECVLRRQMGGLTMVDGIAVMMAHTEWVSGLSNRLRTWVDTDNRRSQSAVKTQAERTSRSIPRTHSGLPSKPTPRHHTDSPSGLTIGTPGSAFRQYSRQD